MKRIEKIKSMNAAEMAEMIFNIGADINMLDRGGTEEVDNMCRQCLIDWLMEEADHAAGD